MASVKDSGTKENAGRWIDEEILYNHAVDHGFDRDESKRSNRVGIERGLLGRQFLRHLSQEGIVVTNEEVLEYYKNNIAGFKSSRPSAKIFHVFLKDVTEAENTLKKLSASGKKTEKNELFIEKDIRPVFVKSGELIEELDNIIFNNKSKKKLHGPIKSSYGYHVVYIIERYKQGSALEVDLVYDEIFQRLFQQKYALKSLHILDSLRSHTPYNIN